MDLDFSNSNLFLYKENHNINVELETPSKSVCIKHKALQMNIILPGRNPGTSTNVMIGMLNASQKRTKRAPFTDALMSRQPRKYKQEGKWAIKTSINHISQYIPA